jgi:cobaltochelatase CobN
MWNSHLPLLNQAAASLDFVECTFFSTRELEEHPEQIESIIKILGQQDIILLYRSSETVWSQIEDSLKNTGKEVPIVCLGHDPVYWSLSSAPMSTVAKAYSYIVNNGVENIANLLKYLCRELKQFSTEVPEPLEMPWQGLYHPDAPSYFENAEQYASWYTFKNNAPVIGILITRHAWVTGDLDVENAIIRSFEQYGANVIPVFSYATKNEETKSRGSAAVVEELFVDNKVLPGIDALVKLQSFFLGGNNSRSPGAEIAEEGVGIMKKIDVPVFCPITTASETVDQWKSGSQGFTGRLVGWSVAMPEFEGVIEPIMVGAGTDNQSENGTIRRKTPIDERIQRLSSRVLAWVRLQKKPVQDRKIAFILHNNPCASVEASVGGAAKLDTLESVAEILKAMKLAGYSVETPVDGKELIENIMHRKAISEFRWTTAAEIVQKGGALKLVSNDEYGKWFNALSDTVRQRMIEAWGNPPGEMVNDIPPAMVHDGKIVVTGVQYGNTIICVQPKRGCAGARCDGRVCKILHEPGVVPPHQYVATYRFIEDDFGADAIVHVGTHGNLEFLPGKGVGLSGDCFPDIALGSLPHLYIYNSDNPPEGVIAKRRSNATLVDHMQTVMTSGGLYDDLEELERLLSEYERVKGEDRTRDHLLQHQIFDLIEKSNLNKEISVDYTDSTGNRIITRLSEVNAYDIHDLPFDQIVAAAHEALSVIRNSFITDGMHIFGKLPDGQRRTDFIYSILRYDADGSVSLRKTIGSLMGISYNDLLKDKSGYNAQLLLSNGQIVEQIDQYSKLFISGILNKTDDYNLLAKDILGSHIVEPSLLPQLGLIINRIVNLNGRIEASREIESLLHGFDGGYIPPGPSGLIMRGREDILPTGRNFYTLDPQKVPTKSAWQVGQRLAEAVIKKHRKEQGSAPENVAIYWMANDIMWADGEGMAQIMYLIGVEPVWQPNGRLNGFRVLSLDQLGRERIDVTIRISGIARDNFAHCVELIDEAIQTVASLDEPLSMNFIRKHSMMQLAENGQNAWDTQSWRDATLRIFASKPGTYSAGTQLAVYASAWKDEKDLADIFLYWNGYAYGKGVFGEEKHNQLASNLKSVDITYNKVVSDESDLFGCCSYFGTQGGMTAAARHLSGKKVKTYYGDTREPQAVEVRDMADEIRRVVRTKLLNPKWIEGQKRHGYKGAGDIMKRVGRVYGWEATTQEVDDWIFDDIAETFVIDKENRQFFEENNPWALEEISRRLLEAEQRGLWKADPQVLEKLKDSYLEIESWLEEDMGDVSGEFQGGMIDVLTAGDVSSWGEKIAAMHKKLNKNKG